MSYLVLARKYRPQTFEDIIGQEPIAKTLARAIEQDRVAHAILLTGSRGVGKTSMARILAKALNCVTGPTPTPCNTCEVCRSITAGGDLDVIEIDGASNNRVDEIRELRDNVKLVSARSRYKIYIIDEIHMLSISAFNALLKTLEEPPSHVKFIFATTNPQKLPETIHSRCQRFDFRPIPESKLRAALASICDREGVSYEDGGIGVISRAGRGSMRDSLTLLDQMLVACDSNLTAERVAEALGVVSQDVLFELVDAMAASRTDAVLDIIARVYEGGRDLSTLVGQLVEHLRQLMIAIARGGAVAGEHTPEEAERFREQTQQWDLDRILYAMQILGEAEMRIRNVDHPRIVVESALVRLARWDEWATLEEILAILRGGDSPPGGGGGRSAPGTGASPAAREGSFSRRAAPGTRAPGARGASGSGSPGPRPGSGGGAVASGGGSEPPKAKAAAASSPTATGSAVLDPEVMDREEPVATATSVGSEAPAPMRALEPETETESSSEPVASEPESPPERPEPAAADLSREAIEEKWDAFLAAVQRRGRPSIAAFVRGGKLGACAGTTVELVFPPTKRFVAKQFELADTKKVLDASSEEVFGVKLRLTPSFTGADDKSEPEDAAPRRQRGPLDPNIKRVMDLFEGRIVGREE